MNKFPGRHEPRSIDCMLTVMDYMIGRLLDMSYIYRSSSSYIDKARHFLSLMDGYKFFEFAFEVKGGLRVDCATVTLFGYTDEELLDLAIFQCELTDDPPAKESAECQPSAIRRGAQASYRKYKGVWYAEDTLDLSSILAEYPLNLLESVSTTRP